MKAISIQLDEATVDQIRELAQKWKLSDVRHNTSVISRCVERVWMLEIGCEKLNEEEKELDNKR